eukprot:481066-Prymnesium_polylepis.1
MDDERGSAMQHFSQVLQASATLTSIDLSDNFLKCADAVALCPGVKASASLKVLRLANGRYGRGIGRGPARRSARWPRDARGTESRLPKDRPG